MAAQPRVVCDYCDRAAQLVGAAKIYPSRPDLAGKWFWRCGPCDAWVGCHPGTMRPLGRLAKADLRQAKQQVHALLDPLWKSGAMTRKEAYALLASGLGISIQNCHVGMFAIEGCEAACRVLRAILDTDTELESDPGIVPGNKGRTR